MLLLEEIGVEIVMIACILVAVSALAYLLQASVREQLYLRRLRRERQSAVWTTLRVASGPSENGPAGMVQPRVGSIAEHRPAEPATPRASRAGRRARAVLREKHV